MKFENNWRFKTLENLEKEVWPKIDSEGHLVTRRQKLRKVPLNEFSVEDLRIMIGQGLGLRFLIPLAMERLKENVLAEGDFYPGDLLVAVTSVQNEFWVGNIECKEQLQQIISDNLSLILNSKLKVPKAFLG